MQGLVLIALGILTIGTATQPSQSSAIRPPAESADLCTVVGHPDAYLGHRISIEADVLADGMHGSVLVSPQCEHGLIPDFTNAEALGRRYERAIFSGRPGTLDKTIHAKFTGVLRHEPANGRFNLAQLIYVLHVDSMEHLTVTFKPDSRP